MVTISIHFDHETDTITVSDNGNEYDDVHFYNDGEVSTATIERWARSEAEDRAAHYGPTSRVVKS
jgi:hypothetical protein